MIWLHRGQVDMLWGRATLARGLPLSWSVTLLLVLFVLDQGLGVPQLPPLPAPSLGPGPKDSHTQHTDVPSISGALGSIPKANHTTVSLGEPLNRTDVTASQLPSRRPLPQTPRSPTPVDQNGSRKAESRSLRQCCPLGHVIQENGDCVLSKTPVLNLTRLVGNEQCGDLSLVKPVTCSSEQEISVVSITSSKLICSKNKAMFLHKRLKWDFCVGVGEDGENFKALLCKEKPKPELCHNKGRVHVNKCCHCGQVLNEGNCEKHQANSSAINENWVDPFQEWASEKELVVRAQKPSCEFGRYNYSKFKYGLEGPEVHLYSETGAVFDDYCLDSFMYKNKTIGLIAQVCIIKPSLWQRIRFYILPVGFSISVVLLSINIFFHLSLPELRRAKQLYIVFYMFMLLVSDVNLVVAQLFNKRLSKDLCSTLGFLIQYFTTSTFCWLTVMCIDVLQQTRICSDFNLLVRRQNSTNKKNLIIYCIFAFGFPLVLCMITIAMQFSYLDENSPYNPNIGKSSCFFESHDRKARMFYFDIPMGILSTVNLIMLALAFNKISEFTKAYKHQRTTITTNSRSDNCMYIYSICSM